MAICVIMKEESLKVFLFHYIPCQSKLLLSDKSFQTKNNSLIYSMLYKNFSNGAYP